MNFRYETKKIKQGYNYVIGCDEVGRGCLAGPVVAAAVVLPDSGDKLKVESYKVIKSAGIRDSKLLSSEKREDLATIIKDCCLGWGIGVVDEKTIDKINIHNASLLAMKHAVEKLLSCFIGVIPRSAADEESLKLDNLSNVKGSLRSSSDAFGLGRDDTARTLLAIDGKFTIPDLIIDQEAIIDGDNKILSIAAASIIAKVYRDDLMRKLHQQYPIYNLKQHKGYATLFHRTIILKNGLSPIHRRSFCGSLFPSLDGQGLGEGVM